MARVLIVEDQVAVAEALSLLLELHDIACDVVVEPKSALLALAQPRFDLVIQDMNFRQGETDGTEGVALFRAVRAAHPNMPVLLLTAWASLETAVQLMREGARDYVAKPWDDARLLASVRSVLELHPYLHGQADDADDDAVPHVPGSVFVSPAIRKVLRMAVRVAASDVPVLITGPNGAGKEKIAEVIVANSQRRERPFVRVNAGALPETLLEAELFGAEAGAFTGAAKRRVGRFEAAQGGTMLLDEIGNLSPTGQMRMLRVLQTGEFERLGSSVTQHVDVRVLAATNSNLDAAIKRGAFREDLFYRLNVVELRVPGLAERREDIIPLARHFLAHAGGDGEDPVQLSPRAERRLLDHMWPGNVRELQNTMRRAKLLARNGLVRPEDLTLPRQSVPAARCRVENDAAMLSSSARSSESQRGDARDLAERDRIEAALRDQGGVVAHAAEQLGLSRQALYRRMDKLGIVVERTLRPQ